MSLCWWKDVRHVSSTCWKESSIKHPFYLKTEVLTIGVVGLAAVLGTSYLLLGHDLHLSETLMRQLFDLMGATVYLYALLSFFMWLALERIKYVARSGRRSRLRFFTHVLRYLVVNHKLFSFCILVLLANHTGYYLATFSPETALWPFVNGLTAAALLMLSITVPWFFARRQLRLAVHAWFGGASVLMASLHIGQVTVTITLIVLILLAVVHWSLRKNIPSRVVAG